jgi:tRNA pseudouridine55 synthase
VGEVGLKEVEAEIPPTVAALRRRVLPMDGIVVMDKPAGMTSHDMVNRLRRIYATRRVGHTGTLDPLATGVLVVCVGEATRIAEYLSRAHKEYVAGVVFGVTTSTEDAAGALLSETDAGHLSEEDVRKMLPAFCGVIQQIPPMVSAVHYKGKRLYELARHGIAVERQPRTVEIYRLELLSFTPGRRARAELCVECSTGTYIRTLAADLGTKLGVGGMLEALRRTRVGPFTLAQAYTLPLLETHRESGTLASTLHSLAEALPDWPRLRVGEKEIQRIMHGQPIACSLDEPGGKQLHSDRRVLLLHPCGHVVAIARLRGETLAPEKVFTIE